jgi:hypothetical protein
VSDSGARSFGSKRRPAHIRRSPRSILRRLRIRSTS